MKGRGKGNGRNGTGHGMGKGKEEGREREERGYTPNFYSWRRHCSRYTLHIVLLKVFLHRWSIAVLVMSWSTLHHN